jgi:hypothetical protein
MEDRWLLFGEGPDARGIMRVHFLRSWNRCRIAEMRIKVDSVEGDGQSESVGRVLELVWESDERRVRKQTEFEAKKLVREVCEKVLGVELGEEAEEEEEEEEEARDGDSGVGEG